MLAAPSHGFTGPTGGFPQQARSLTTDARVSVLQQLSETDVSDEEIALIVKLLQQPDLQQRIDKCRYLEGITPSRHTSPSNVDPVQVQEHLSDENSNGPNLIDPVLPIINDPDSLGASAKRGPNRRMDFVPAQRDIFFDNSTYRSQRFL